MAIKRKMNLGFGTDPDAVNLASLPPQSQGQIGGIYEQGTKGWQFVKLVDAGPAVAGDVGYDKAYAGQYEVTRTIGNSTLGVNGATGIFTVACVLNQYTLLRKLGPLAVVKSEAAYTGAGAQGFGHTANNSLNGVAAGVAPINKVVAIGTAAAGGGFTASVLQFPYV